MNTLDFFISLYSLERNYKYVPSYLLTPFRRLTRCLANIILPKILKSKRDKCKQHTGVVVSLTSFPARINEVWQVIECIMRQTYRPARIYLWLSKEQFPSSEMIPEVLRKLENDVFCIRLVEGDIRSHKKYYYIAKENPSADIILVDDDIYYPTTMIEELILSAQKYPNCVICRYGSLVSYSKDGIILPYAEWEEVNKYTINSRLFFGTGGGTLIRSSMLFKDLLNKELFLNLTPLADDIWVNAMVRLAKTPIVMLKPSIILPVQGKGTKVTLCNENVTEGKNDVQIKAVSEYYLKHLGIDPFAITYKVTVR